MPNFDKLNAVLTAIRKQVQGKRLSKAEKQLLCEHKEFVFKQGVTSDGRAYTWHKCELCGKNRLELAHTANHQQAGGEGGSGGR